MKVSELLKLNNRAVITASQNDTVQDALKKMVENNIGALPVVDGGNIAGIVTERDLLKVCSTRPADTGKIKLKDIMTKDVVIGLPEDDLDYVESVMAQKRIRHLPIMDGASLAGMVSVRDVVAHQLKQAKAEARFLNDYIAGRNQ